MANPRASIFADDELDVSSFSPKTGADQSAPPAEKVKTVAEEARFHSREPKPAAAAEPKRTPRRHRTGRNIQFNVKASQETLDAFYAITDRQGWVLGETLEHALAALQRELDNGGGAGAS
jgi:hypothetical protein